MNGTCPGCQKAVRKITSTYDWTTGQHSHKGCRNEVEVAPARGALEWLATQ